MSEEQQRRRVSVRRIIQTLVTMIVVTGAVVAMLSADKVEQRKNVRNVLISLANDNQSHFTDRQQIMNTLFTDRHITPQSLTLSKLDIHNMESVLQSNPWVSNAQIYVDNQQDMHILVTQRVPVLRIFDKNGDSYYLDTALQTMPLSEHYTPYLPVITNAPTLQNDSAGRSMRAQMLYMSSYIGRNKFWSAQVAALNMEADNTFSIIPVVGRQRLLLGDTSQLGNKLENIYSFYSKVLNKIGWDKYDTLDARYANQIVASPALKWKAPVDKALSDMNWVKAILADGEKKAGNVEVNGADTLGIKATPPPNTPTSAFAPQAPVQQQAAGPFPVPSKPKPAVVATPVAQAHPAAPKPKPKPKHDEHRDKQVVKHPDKHDAKPAKHTADKPKPKPKPDGKAKKPATAVHQIIGPPEERATGNPPRASPGSKP